MKKLFRSRVKTSTSSICLDLFPIRFYFKLLSGRIYIRRGKLLNLPLCLPQKCALHFFAALCLHIYYYFFLGNQYRWLLAQSGKNWSSQFRFLFNSFPPELFSLQYVTRATHGTYLHKRKQTATKLLLQS